MVFLTAAAVGAALAALVGVNAPAALAGGLVLWALARGLPRAPRPRAGVSRAARGVAALLLGASSTALSVTRPMVLGDTAVPTPIQGQLVARHCAGERCWLRLRHASALGDPLDRGVAELSLSARELLLDPVQPGDLVGCDAVLYQAGGSRNPGDRARSGRPRPPRAVARGPVQRLARGQLPWWIRARRALDRPLQLRTPALTQLYRALLLGEREALPSSVRVAFLDTGTGHLLAISGLHLALLGWGLYRALLWLLCAVPALAQAGRPDRWAAAAALTLVWLYVPVVGAPPATLRAAVFLTLALGGLLASRAATPSRTLGVAAAALVLADPVLTATASFQLSFAAAAAVVAVLPAVRAAAAWWDEPGRLPAGPRAGGRLTRSGWQRAARALTALTLITSACFAATAPLGLAWFGTLAWVGLVVNLVAVPLVSAVVLPVGALWLALAAAWPQAATALAGLPEAAASLLLTVIQAWAEWAGPATHPTWPLALGWLGSSVVVSALARRWRVTLALSGVALGLACCLGADGARGIAGGAERAQPSRTLARATTTATSPGRGLVLTALDVGHGDAILIQTPDGHAALVDTGGRRGGDPTATRQATEALARRVVVPALLRRGVDALDLLVLTHGDQDHAGAAAALARRLLVRELWVTPCGLQAGTVRRAVARVRARGGRVRVLHAGPAHARWGATWQVLWPPAPPAGPGPWRPHEATRGPCAGGRNGRSLVLAVSAGGHRALLTGDLDAAGEEALLAAEVPLGADVLKVPHHGSRSSSTPAFLAAVAPRVAVVTAGLRPGYMPPHQEVLARYARAGSAVWRTGDDGAVRVELPPGGPLLAAGTPSGRVAWGPQRPRWWTRRAAHRLLGWP